MTSEEVSEVCWNRSRREAALRWLDTFKIIRECRRCDEELEVMLAQAFAAGARWAKKDCDETTNGIAF